MTNTIEGQESFGDRTPFDLIMQDPRKIEEIRILIEAGHTDNFVAKFLNVSPYSFKAWVKRFPDFEAAVKKWKDVADENVVKALYDKAIGYALPETKVFCYEGKIIEHEIVKHIVPDFSSQSLWLRNRKREDWKDIKDMSTKTDVTVKGQLKVGISELSARIEQITGKIVETTAKHIEDAAIEEMLG